MVFVNAFHTANYAGLNEPFAIWLFTEDLFSNSKFLSVTLTVSRYLPKYLASFLGKEIWQILLTLERKADPMNEWHQQISE